jgi:tetratricopeptide (TPR) repeat protein
MNEQLEQIDALIRVGNFSAARRIIRALATTNLPRIVLLQFAKLSRRADLPLLGLRALYPLVHPEPDSLTRATDAEKVEYAACLVRVGACSEAIEILDGIPNLTQPDIGLLRAYALSALWRYDEVVLLLRDVLAQDGLADSLRMALTVTLATSQILCGHYAEAEEEIEDATRRLKKSMNPFLQATWYALSARSLAQQKKWPQASILFDKASQGLIKMGAADLFLASKWKTLAVIMSSTGPKAKRSMEETRKAAILSGHWESVRELDFLYGLRKGDHELFARLYYGTRFRSFRSLMVSCFGTKFSVPPKYVWTAKKLNAKPREMLLRNDELCLDGKRPKTLKLNEQEHHLLSAILSDLYVPTRMTRLNSLIYPERPFDPFHFPALAEKLLLRASKRILSKQMPIQLKHHKGDYARVELGPKVGFVVNKEQLVEAEMYADDLVAERRKAPTA